MPKSEQQDQNPKPDWFKSKPLFIAFLVLVAVSVLAFVLFGRSPDSAENQARRPLPPEYDQARQLALTEQGKNDIDKIAAAVRQAIDGGQAPSGWSDVAGHAGPISLEVYDPAQINLSAPDWLASAQPGDFVSLDDASSRHPAAALGQLLEAIDKNQIMIFLKAICSDSGPVPGPAGSLVVAYRPVGGDVTCVVV